MPAALLHFVVVAALALLFVVLAGRAFDQTVSELDNARCSLVRAQTEYPEELPAGSPSRACFYNDR